MRVGLDAHVAGQRQTGNETYVLGLLHGLEQIDFPVHAYGFAAPPGSIHHWRRLRPRHRAVRLSAAVPLVAARDRLQIYHGTYVLPPLIRCRTVVTVHDVSFLLHPEWFRRDTALLLDRAVRHAVEKAERIIAVSERTRQDVAERYGVPAERIAVTHLAPRVLPPVSANGAGGPDSRLRDRSRERGAYADGGRAATRGGPYLLYVGNIQPRKNVAVLIRALAVLRDRGRAIPLVIAGRGGSTEREIRALVARSRLQDLVHFTGYVPDSMLSSLYAGCTALVHPALYEGFGLTPLEAMAMGRPVIAADAGSIPEVVGDAALLVPPTDIEAWADAIENAVGGQELREELSRRGIRRAACFSWERCARKTVGVYISVA